jgi:hypothetical protein
MLHKLRPLPFLAALLTAFPLFAELALPPSGDNQRAVVSQQVGPVTVRVDYSSPRVTRNGEDRRGKIWGQLVPYGLSDLGFNDCKSCPWRAGANENTVFTTSHAVKVQGQQLPAGRYGLHMIPGKEEFTVIFSKNASSWGSFWYDQKEDVLRVTTKPVKGEFHEWLTYEFTEREPARAVVALEWDELRIPLEITVSEAPALFVETMREQLRSDTGFIPANWERAADYNLKNKVNLPEALAWAEKAAGPNVGEINFRTLMLLSRAQSANGQAEAANKSFQKALDFPGAQPIDLHLAGRGLLADGKKKEALEVFQQNAKRFPDQWPVHVGLMRGYAANGDLKTALTEAKMAEKQAPDEANRKNLKAMIKKLEDGKSID